MSEDGRKDFPWYLKQARDGLPLALREYCMGPHDALLYRPWLVLDFETTNKDKGWAGNPHNRIVCGSSIYLGHDEGAFVASEYGDEFNLPELSKRLDTVRALRGVLVAHNAKFEAGWVRRMGFDPSDFLWWDTLLAEYVEAGNRRWTLNLDDVAQRYGCSPKDPLIDRLMKNGVCPSQIDATALLRRNAKDVEDTALIALMQIERMEERKKRVVFTRCLSVPVIADVERQGVAVDPKRVDAAIAEAEEELRLLNQRWEQFARAHIKQANLPEWMQKKINLAAGDHVAFILYHVLKVKELKTSRGEIKRNKPTKRWPTGKPLANDKALSQLKLETEAQREFIQLRKDISRVKSALSKTLYFYKGVCEMHGGVFYGQFNQSTTQTHRTSSSGRKLPMPDGKQRGVQLQNQPRKYHKLRCAKKGQLASHDAAQLEFRTAVELGDDDAGRKNIADGVDQHRMTASELLQIHPQEVTDEQRQFAKADTFKPLYGGRKGTEAQVRYYEAFREWFPGISAEQERWTEEVLQTGKLELPWGMTFYWPGTKMNPRDGYIDNTPSIYNYPVQNLATAEIVPVSVVYLYYRMRAVWGSQAKLVCMVHDSAEAEIPKSEAASGMWLQLGKLAFGVDTYTYLYAVYGMGWQTPLGLGTKSEMVPKEIKTDLEIIRCPLDKPVDTE